MFKYQKKPSAPYSKDQIIWLKIMTFWISNSLTILFISYFGLQ